MKIKYDLWLFVLGIFMASLGFVLVQNHISRAAGQTYSESYSVSKWHNMKLGSAPPYSNNYVSFGPAEWTVSGNVGSTSYSETWSASDWKDESCTVGKGISGRCNSTISYGTSDNSTYYSGGGTLQTNTAAARIGMYSIIGLYPDSGSDYYLETFSSVPSKWNVSGTINTP